VSELPEAVEAFSERLSGLGWVPDLLVGGSLATGDYVPGVSDLDLVAILDGPIDQTRTAHLIELHGELDRGLAAGADLGCVYVDESRLTDGVVLHPTWTHGGLVHRTLSGISRAELVRHGFAVYGRRPDELFPPMTDDQVRAAAWAELCGYWAWASRRPWMWLYPVIADLGLTSMARGRSALDTGQLLTKSEAIEKAHAPVWLIDQLRARRRGEPVHSRRLATGWIAWRDARRTVRAARSRRGLGDETHH
jgi:Nucleotidyltransferase domain